MLESVHLSGDTIQEWSNNNAVLSKNLRKYHSNSEPSIEISDNIRNEARRKRSESVDIIGGRANGKRINEELSLKELNNTSRIQIFIKRNNIGPKLINSIVYTKNLLQLKGIYEDEIEEVVLEDDIYGDKQALIILEQIPENSGRKDFPVIFFNGIPIGTVSDLEESMVSPRFDKLLEEERNSTNRERRTPFTEKMKSMNEQKNHLSKEILKAKQQNSSYEIINGLRKSIQEIDDELDHIDTLLKSRESQSSRSRSSSSSSSLPPSPISSSPSKSPIDKLNEVNQLVKEIETEGKEIQIKNSETPTEMQMATVDGTIVDLALESGKSFVINVGSAISSFSSYFSWSNPINNTSITATNSQDHSNAIISSPNLKENKDGTNYTEFEVIQINWYWRQQKRILRFANDKVFRLNPFTKELRAVHKYTNIEKITVTEKNFITIFFNNETQPEYYQSQEMETILSVILSKTKHLSIPVTYVNEPM